MRYLNEHDPMCPFPAWARSRKAKILECQCELIAKVRADTLDKAIDGLQPIWERGKALEDAVFADGWLTCFESCESALETMRGES